MKSAIISDCLFIKKKKFIPFSIFLKFPLLIRKQISILLAYSLDVWQSIYSESFLCSKKPRYEFIVLGHLFMIKNN